MYLQPLFDQDVVRDLLKEVTREEVEYINTEDIIKSAKKYILNPLFIEELTELVDTWKNIEIETCC
jgi:hypothetical protein